jgi:hypothetical protein
MIAAILLAAAATEAPMNEPIIAALDRALKGDKKILEGLGIEEAMITGPSWDDRIAVDGAGAVTFTSPRPSGDTGGAPIGVFRGKLEKDDLQAVIKTLQQLAATPPPPARAEAYETRILISVVAGGQVFSLAAPANPAALAPLKPILITLGRAMSKAMESPVRSLTLKLEAPEGVAKDGSVALVLHLLNGGDEGFWVSNPLTVANQPEHERAELVYAKPLVLEPGIAPVPVKPGKTLLVPRRTSAGVPPYRWVPPKGDVEVPMAAKVVVGDAKELVFRAGLIADEGADVIAGRPRLKGSVFSADVTVKVQ